MHTKRRILKCIGLYCRNNEHYTIDVVSFLNDQLMRHQRLIVYKLHHLCCVQAGYVITRSTVRHLFEIHKKWKTTLL